MKKHPRSRNPKPNAVLEKLGLQKDEVRAAFGLEMPESEKPKKKGYLFLEDQKKMIKRMKFWSNMIFARYEAGMSPTIIAGVLGVSEETVRVRLRRNGYFATPR